jgi:hypothetical protein
MNWYKRAQSNIDAIRENRPRIREMSLEWAKEKGTEITPEGNLVLFHGTSPRNAKLIERTRRINAGTYFDGNSDVARRFGCMTISRGNPVVLKAIVDPSAVTGGSYWSLNEDVYLDSDNVYRPRK